MRYTIPYSKVKSLFRRKYPLEDGAIVEMRAWSVPRSARMTEGVKYSLVYIDSHGRRVLGYDNAEGKGHHRHKDGKETPFEFESMDKLVKRFLKELGEIRRLQP